MLGRVDLLDRVEVRKAGEGYLFYFAFQINTSATTVGHKRIRNSGIDTRIS